MRLARPAVPLRALVALATCAACASSRAPGTRLETEAVRVAEPAAAAEPMRVEQPVPEESTGDALLLAMTRMVANDGATRPLAWKGVPMRGLLGCEVRFLGAPGDALYGGSVHDALDPLTGLPLRGFGPIGGGIGVVIGGDGVSPLLFASPCRGDLVGADAASRVARLAPELTGRDTSHLFSTARAATGIGRQAGGTELLGVLLGLANPPSPQSPPAPGRTAKPRGTAATGSSASPPPASPSAAAPPAAPATPAKGETPKGDGSADDRKGGFLGGLVKTVTGAGGARAH